MTMPSSSRFVSGGTGTIVLDELWDNVAEVFINDATVTATVRKPDSTAILLDQPMPYVAQSNGRYRLDVDASHTTTLEVGDVVEVTATAVLPDGRKQVFRERVWVTGTGEPRPMP